MLALIVILALLLLVPEHAFLVLLSHRQNSSGTQCRDMKARGERNRNKVVTKNRQRVRGSPETQK